MNRLILTLLLIQGYALGQPSEYVPIPEDATWLYECGTYVVDGNHPDGGYDIINQYLFQLSSDTVINDTAYMLFREQKLGEPMIYTEVALRQNYDERKVYARPLDFNAEFLLYDFNLQIGDTMFCTGGGGFGVYHYAETGNQGGGTIGTGSQITLDSISTDLGSAQLSGDLNTRVFHFAERDWGRSSLWVEGVGSIIYFSLPCSKDGEFTSCSLSAFCAGDTVWSPWESACDLVLNDHTDAYNSNNNFSVFWDGSSLILTNLDSKRLNQVEIFDLGGRLVWNTSLTTIINGGRVQISGIELSTKGVYVVRIRTENSVSSQLIRLNL